MIRRNVKFQYFVLTRQKKIKDCWKGMGKLDIEAWMNKVLQNDLLNKTIDMGDAKASIDRAKWFEKDSVWVFRFMKLREDNIPSIVKENNEAKAIKLQPDEYIGEAIHMLYECETGIAMLQINRFSLGRERLEDLLSTIWNMAGERIRLVPIMDKDQFEAMARRKYRSIEVSFANIEPQLESGKNSLGTIMGLYKKFQGVSGSIKISLGKKRKGTLSIDEISEFVTDAMVEKSVKALKLHVKDDDSKPVEIIDLFDTIANSVITFKMENRTVLEYNYTAQLMIKSYKDKKIYLLKSIRV